MFKRIAVAYSESPETRCAVTSAIHLAKTLGAELRAIIVLQAPSAYRASAEAVDPSLKKIINSEQVQAYEQLHSQAYEAALREESTSRLIFWEARSWTPSSTSSLITKQISSWSDSSSPIARITSMEDGLCTYIGCYLQRPRGPLKPGRHSWMPCGFFKPVQQMSIICSSTC